MLKNTRQFSSATSIFKNLKLKIASSLTSSLSSTDRTKLLQSLNINVDEEGHRELKAQKDELEKKGAVPDKSIGEAVAAAVAKEAAKNKELSQKKIDEIWKRAEEATTERLKNDLLIKERKLAMKRWEMELEEEKNRLAREKDQSHTGNVNALPISEDTHHPILGKAIVDLGYKRVHLVSAKSLSSIPIWEKQRVYRHDRAKEMAADKMKSLSLGLPGVIAIHETNDGDLSILDGQHRVGMMTILQELIQKKGDEEESNLLDLTQILVEVFPMSFSPHYTSEGHHAKDIFTEINKAEPVAVLDLPGKNEIFDFLVCNYLLVKLTNMIFKRGCEGENSGKENNKPGFI